MELRRREKTGMEREERGRRRKGEIGEADSDAQFEQSRRMRRLAKSVRPALSVHLGPYLS